MCGYAEDRTLPLSGSGACPLLAKRDPFCALQACLKVRLFRLFTTSLLDVGFLHGTGAGAAQFVGLLDDDVYPKLGHSVVVLASGQLTYLGYAPGHSFLASGHS